MRSNRAIVATVIVGASVGGCEHRRSTPTGHTASLSQIDAAFAAAQFDLRALIVAVLVSPAFLAPDATSDAGAPTGP